MNIIIMFGLKHPRVHSVHVDVGYSSIVLNQIKQQITKIIIKVGALTEVTKLGMKNKFSLYHGCVFFFKGLLYMVKISDGPGIEHDMGGRYTRQMPIKRVPYSQVRGKQFLAQNKMLLLSVKKSWGHSSST